MLNVHLVMLSTVEATQPDLRADVSSVMSKKVTQVHREFLEAVLESPDEALPRQIADAEFSLAVVEELTRWGYIQSTFRGFKATTTGRAIVRSRASARGHSGRGFADRFSRA